VTRLVCPHCGEYERYTLGGVTDKEVWYLCKACWKVSEWVRASVSEPWRVREGKDGH
jgi:transposase-like protein